MKSFFSIFRVNVLSLALAAVGTTAMVSCSKLDNDNNQEDVPVAGLMAFNLAPDQSGLILTLNSGSITNYPLPYTNYTGGYLSVYPGARTLEAFSSNSPAGESIASATATFEPEKYYSAFTIGAGTSYRNVIVRDNIDSLTATGQAFVRYINAIIDSTKPTTVVISANGSNVLNQSAAYGSVSEFVPVSAGSVNIDINNGTGVDTDRTITLEQNKIYTVLLTGLPGTTPAADMIKFIANGQVTDQVNNRQSSARSAAN